LPGSPVVSTPTVQTGGENYGDLYKAPDKKLVKKFRDPGIAVDESTLISHVLFNGVEKDIYEESSFPQGLVVDIIKDVDISRYPGGESFTKPVTCYKIVPKDSIPKDTSDLSLLKLTSRIFYPPYDGFSDTFSVGDIVNITYPKNFPANKNELDNRYYQKAASNPNGTPQQAATPPVDVSSLKGANLSATTDSVAAPKGGQVPSTGKGDYVNSETKEILSKMSPADFLNPATKAPYVMTSPVDQARMDPAPKPGTIATPKGHAGVDIAYQGLIPIYAGADGIISVGSGGGGGNSVTIEHKYFKTYHGHLKAWAKLGPNGELITIDNFQKAQKELNGKVLAGQIIGFMGNTGTHTTGQHLHWQFKPLTGTTPNNIIYFMKNYGYIAGPAVKRKYGITGNIINVPFTNTGGSSPSDSGSTNSKAAPKPKDTSSEGAKGENKQQRSPPRNRPRMKFVRFLPDFLTTATSLIKKGSPEVLIREDMHDDLIKIKKILNKFGVKMSLESYDPTISSNILENCGLAININEASAVNPEGDVSKDMFVLSFKNGESSYNHKKLTIWAKVKVAFEEYEDCKVFRGVLPVLNIKKSFSKKSKPEEEKLYGTFINITEILEKNGFRGGIPNFNFVNNSIYKNSGWNNFYYTKVLKKNITTTIDLIESIYDSDDLIKKYGNKTWDGSSFIG
jgi:murein DD-endopeptidase MepM/ murein hydrolase activator NlpD